MKKYRVIKTVYVEIISDSEDDALNEADVLSLNEYQELDTEIEEVKD